MFRVNVLCFWIALNALYVIILDSAVSSDSPAVNDGHLGFLEYFSMYLSGMASYKFLFGAFHILRFKCRLLFTGDLRVHRIDLKKDYEKLKGKNGADDEFDMDKSLLVQK
jgi:hypothetical protein